MGRRTFLLGAGASAEAGVPVSTKMTEEIVRIVSRRDADRARALNYAVAALIAHNAIAGNSGAYDGLDVEEFFAAIETLAGRRSMDAAPFVAAWSRPLEEAENEGAFDHLAHHVMKALQQVTTVDEVRVDYLAPLLAGDDHPIQIATLNYDRSIELVANRAGMTLDTGIGRWQGEFGWDWDDDAAVRLLKLHGSTDWDVERTNAKRGSHLASERIVPAAPLKDIPGVPSFGVDRSYVPEVIFGKGNKLRARGPYLAMLIEFDRMLAESDQLIVVGYAFGDDHINQVIARWFNGRPDPQVTVIDPLFGNHRRDYRQPPRFDDDLYWAMCEPHSPEPSPDGLPSPDMLRAGMQVLYRKAGEALPFVLGAGPTLNPPSLPES
jgi:hypothetical protein